jgi:membrane-bound lytic murein transglycosylase D
MGERKMRRSFVLHLALVWLLFSAALPALADPDHFPVPASIAPRVAFWKRIYTEVDTKSGLLHDAEDLSLVYDVVRPPASLSPANWQRYVDGRRKHVETVLRRLGQGVHGDLDAEEKRVLALFPTGVSDRTLRGAAGRVRFQLGQADKFQAGLVRQGRWRHYMEQTFEERGMPTELTALPHVESSFNPFARSSVGASGLWQFMPSTGRLYMRVDGTVDERNDPWVATIAAARLLQHNYEATGSWPIALTAYNHGLGGMTRAMRQHGTRDIGVIVDRYESRSFGFASKNFYSEFLAALEIDREPARFFGPIRPDPPEAPEIVVLDHYYRPSTLARAFGITPDALREANLGLTDSVWRGEKLVPKGYALRIPPDPLRAAPRVVLAEIPAKERLGSQYQDRTHTVRRGETLSRIASRYGVTVKALMAKNGIRSANRVRAGQRLAIPGVKVAEPAPSSSAQEVRIAAAPVVAPPAPAPPPSAPRALTPAQVTVSVPGPPEAAAAAPATAPAAEPHAASPADPLEPAPVPEVAEVPAPALPEEPAPLPPSLVHVVRRGETVGRIAKRYGVSEKDLLALNHLSNPNLVRVGQKLQVPTGQVGGSTPERTVYTVRRGDTLGKIAKRFGVSQGQLLAMNKISNRHEIRAGQRLLVPTAE